jgi:hypothetical protein
MSAHGRRHQRTEGRPEVGEGRRAADRRPALLRPSRPHAALLDPLRGVHRGGFADGYGFDGSSIRGYQEIQESLVPDPVAAYIDPFLKVPTLAVHCFVRDPITGEMYSRPPAGSRRRPGCTSRRPASRTPRGDRSASYTSSPRSGSTRNQDEGNYQIDSVARSPQQSDSSPPRSDYGCNRAKIDRRAGRLIGIGGDDGSPGDPLRLADATPSTAPGRRPPTATRSSRTCVTPGSR